MIRILSVTLLTAGLFAGGLAAPAVSGINKNDTTGALLCKGKSSCTTLKANCADGHYTDATQKDGAVYGKCTKTAKIVPPSPRFGLKGN